MRICLDCQESLQSGEGIILVAFGVRQEDSFMPLLRGLQDTAFIVHASHFEHTEFLLATDPFDMLRIDDLIFRVFTPPHALDLDEGQILDIIRKTGLGNSRILSGDVVYRRMRRAVEVKVFQGYVDNADRSLLHHFITWKDSFQRECAACPQMRDLVLKIYEDIQDSLVQSDQLSGGEHITVSLTTRYPTVMELIRMGAFERPNPKGRSRGEMYSLQYSFTHRDISYSGFLNFGSLLELISVSQLNPKKKLYRMRQPV